MMRLVHLNPIEPGTISGRATAGYDCVIDIVYRNAADQTYTADLAATLVLTARSSDSSVSYIVPSTDMVNGKARVTIPGGDLSDPNGYAMTLVGTVDGVRQVIGQGTLILSGSGVTEVITADSIDQIPLVLSRAVNATFDVAIWHDVGKGSPYDLAGSTIAAAVLDRAGGTVLQPFVVTVTGDNDVRLTMTAASIATLPGQCWWTLTISTSAGVTTLAEGMVTVTA